VAIRYPLAKGTSGAVAAMHELMLRLPWPSLLWESSTGIRTSDIKRRPLAGKAIPRFAANQRCDSLLSIAKAILPAESFSREWKGRGIEVDGPRDGTTAREGSITDPDRYVIRFASTIR
jgi:hypothetical protein